MQGLKQHEEVADFASSKCAGDLYDFKIFGDDFEFWHAYSESVVEMVKIGAQTKHSLEAVQKSIDDAKEDPKKADLL